MKNISVFIFSIILMSSGELGASNDSEGLDDFVEFQEVKSAPVTIDQMVELWKAEEFFSYFILNDALLRVTAEAWYWSNQLK